MLEGIVICIALKVNLKTIAQYLWQKLQAFDNLNLLHSSILKWLKYYSQI